MRQWISVYALHWNHTFAVETLLACLFLPCFTRARAEPTLPAL